MKLKPYEFSADNWPPPKEENERGNYLFGFDDDYTPYILRYETQGQRGWHGATLESSMSGSSSTFPSYLDSRDVERRIKWYSKTPVAKYIEKRYG